jgi:hypothetical protein
MKRLLYNTIKISKNASAIATLYFFLIIQMTIAIKRIIDNIHGINCLIIVTTVKVLLQ